MTLSDPTPSFKVILQFEGEYISQTVHATAGNVTSRGFLNDSWGFLFFSGMIENVYENELSVIWIC